MIAPFEIFGVEVDGALIWRFAAETLEETKQRVCDLAATRHSSIPLDRPDKART
jgi:hypothetical protein